MDGIGRLSTGDDKGGGAGPVRVVQPEMDKDEFLKLLTTQLKYQDPIDPIKDQDFVAQLAQFSALEQTQNLAKQMGEFVEVQLWLGSFSQAASFLGREVTIQSEGGEPIQGTVSSVQVVDGVPKVMVEGQLYGLRDVVEVQA